MVLQAPSGAIPAGQNNLYSRTAWLYITPGADVTFTGELVFATDSGTQTLSGSFSTVPEPSTLLLAASGLAGLLCYAWRKAPLSALCSTDCH